MATRHNDVHSLATIVEQINHFFDQVVQSANNRRLALIEEANARNTEIESRVSRRAQTEQTLMGVKTEIEHKIRNNELRELQEQMLAEIEEKLAKVRGAQGHGSSLVFRCDYGMLEQLFSDVSEIVEQQAPKYRELKKELATGKCGNASGELLDPSGIAIDESSGYIYVTECGSARVSVFSASAEFLHSFTHEHMAEPYGVAIRKDNVYVSDREAHGVFHFKIETDIRLVATLAGKGSSEGRFDSPHQLAVSDRGEVFVADSNNHRVPILDEFLEFKRSITHESMHFPRDVKLTNQEVYVLSSSDSPCIHVFSHAGQKTRSFITSHGGQVTGAWFFCLDAQKNLFISDVLSHSVKIFSCEGALVHKIEELRKESYRPQGLALSKQHRLFLISQHDEFQLQAYSC